MRIIYWSSDVCSSDLACDLVIAAARNRQPLAGADDIGFGEAVRLRDRQFTAAGLDRDPAQRIPGLDRIGPLRHRARIGRARVDRKSVVEGKSVSVRLVLGGRRIIKKKKTKRTYCKR